MVAVMARQFLTIIHLVSSVNSQRRAILVPASNQQRHTERSGHDALLALCSLAESQRKIAYALCAALDGQRLRIVEVM